MSNPIEDLECPKCGHSKSFYISAFIFGKVDRRGIHVEDFSTFDWDKESLCTCGECSFISNIKAFTKIYLEEGEDFSGYDEEDYK